ncbi:EF-hand domain-containing protein [Rhizobium sp. BG4]|uniref:EF-hand domain-containing protein n=1 Tax=Rhizobium sp. BG4 TaxID=2613770 RepID=UPI00193DC59D|nr:EF-hand domain-containing protein [Rhizobium sp. BG4]QRM45784.1 EF-hand domain-containing protein [Rhizobium sp. BG4]
MKVGPDNSIYSVFSTANRRPPSIYDEKMVLPASSETKAPPAASDSQLVADFHSRMARQSLDWADADKDGRVTKDEYMSGQARLAELNDRPNDTAGNEKRWSEIDTGGKGWVNETELNDGLAKMLPVSVGHLDQGFAERLRNLRT